MSLGETLRQAREAKGQTLSQVAEATRMMVQVVEDLEREDFRRIAAPIYGRGFLKLYAEHLGVDPEPLIREFMEIYTGSRPPQIARRPAAGEPVAPAVPVEAPADRVDPSDPADTADTLDAGAPLPPSEDPQEPDLFSVAAGRSAAVRSVAEPSQPGDATPPRVRPAAGARASEATTASAPRPERTPLREPAGGDVSSGTVRAGRGGAAWLPPGWSFARIGLILAVVAVAAALLVLAARKLRHKQPGTHAAAPPALTIKHTLPPPEPFF